MPRFWLDCCASAAGCGKCRLSCKSGKAVACALLLNATLGVISARPEPVCVQGLYKQMVDIFRGMGMEACSGKGTVFDPNFHDAIMREQNEDVPDGTILQEFRRGFKIGDRLLRPAMVQVLPTSKWHVAAYAGP